MINKRTESSRVAAHFRTRSLRRKNRETRRNSVQFYPDKMRPQVATSHWLPLLLIDLFSYGLTEDYKKQDLMRSLSLPKRSLTETMMRKYSYPKNEVTAGVGYGHHLHPFYYQGEKKMMYPCAVECGEWETTNLDDNANDASSNVDVVTIRPDVSSIEITTPKARLRYKDVSVLRSKNYKSTTSFPPAMTSPKTYNDYQDSKGADVQIIQHKAKDEYLDGKGGKSKDELNDGSLYRKYHDALISGYEGELNTRENAESKNNEYFDPIGESVRYNPPSFNDEEDNDDIETAIYPNLDDEFHPKGKRIEEKYVKHNLREEKLEDVRTNSFGTSGENDDYPTAESADSGNQSDNYEPQKYVDDYAAPVKPHSSSSGGGKRFRPSPPADQSGERYLPIHSGHYRGRDENVGMYHGPQNQEYLGSYSDYDYGKDGRVNVPSALSPDAAHFNPTSHLSLQQNKRVPNCAKKGPLSRFRSSQRGPQFRGRYQEHPSSTFAEAGYSERKPKTNYYSSYDGKNSFLENDGGPHSYNRYAPGHGYLSLQSPESLPFTGFNSGAIRLVQGPQRPHLPLHGRYPRYKKGIALPVRSSPRFKGQRISYRELIPQRDGFTRIVKKYKSIVGHTPKRYVVPGEPYARL